MGLDQYMYVIKKQGNIEEIIKKVQQNIPLDRKEQDVYDEAFCGEPEYYYRKANFLREYLVSKAGYKDDWDCVPFVVERQYLEELLHICKEVLNEYNEKGHCDEVARNKLATQVGFFFGSTGYDEYYIDSVRRVLDDVREILGNTDFESEVVCYYEWW